MKDIESNMKKKFLDIIFVALFSIFLLLVLAIILGRGRIGVGVENILGIWTSVSKGEVWMTKERFSGISSYLGYAITGLTFLSLSLLGAKSVFGELKK